MNHKYQSYIVRGKLYFPVPVVSTFPLFLGMHCFSCCCPSSCCSLSISYFLLSYFRCCLFFRCHHQPALSAQVIIRSLHSEDTYVSPYLIWPHHVTNLTSLFVGTLSQSLFLQSHFSWLSVAGTLYFDILSFICLFLSFFVLFPKLSWSCVSRHSINVWLHLDLLINCLLSSGRPLHCPVCSKAESNYLLHSCTDLTRTSPGPSHFWK